MTVGRQFIFGWTVLSAVIILMFSLALLGIMAAIGIENQWWILILDCVPPLAAGFIIGRAAPDSRAVEAALGFILVNVVIAAVWALVLLVIAQTPFSLLMVPLAIIGGTFGAILTFAGATFGRKTKYRIPRGWQPG